MKGSRNLVTLAGASLLLAASAFAAGAITSGKKTVASVPAQVVTVSEKNRTDGYGAKKSDDGKNALTDIFFQGKNYEIRLGDQAGADASQPGTTGSNQ